MCALSLISRLLGTAGGSEQERVRALFCFTEAPACRATEVATAGFQWRRTPLGWNTHTSPSSCGWWAILDHLWAAHCFSSPPHTYLYNHWADSVRPRPSWDQYEVLNKYTPNSQLTSELSGRTVTMSPWQPSERTSEHTNVLFPSFGCFQFSHYCGFKAKIRIRVFFFFFFYKKRHSNLNTICLDPASQAWRRKRGWMMHLPQGWGFSNFLPYQLIKTGLNWLKMNWSKNLIWFISKHKNWAPGSKHWSIYDTIWAR